MTSNKIKIRPTSQKIMDHNTVEVCPVVRILQCKRGLVAYVVDYQYFINGNGPVDIHGKPLKELPKDSFWLKVKWFLGGCRRTKGALKAHHVPRERLT